MTDINTLHEDEDYFAHYGILRRSGRYPWGSGGTPEQRARTFLGMVDELKKQGFTPTQIAKSFSTDEHPYNTTMLRATTTMARNAKKAADVATAEKLRAKGVSNTEIGKQMGLNESSVRALLAPGARNRQDRLTTTAQMLRDEVADKGIIQIGRGVENQLGVVKNHLDTAIAMLRSEGYELKNVQVPQAGTSQKTNIKVLAKPGTTYKDIVTDLGQIKLIGQHSDDGGQTFTHIKPPLSVSSKRIKVNYKEDGGDQADGVIYVRPGKEDLSLGASKYAQVRIAVDGSHYLKGMAIYRNDLPDGVDLVFNTNKARADIGSNKLDAMKKLKTDKKTGAVDETNPFGSIVRQLTAKDSKGQEHVTSAMNLVNEEGDWGKWSKTLSSQMLSKQRPALIKERLDTTFAAKKKDLEEILALNNGAIQKKLLEKYADELDGAAVHLKAAALPRQATRVILPLKTIKDHEVYAPDFDDGENVVLIRYPHGGIFEIPELTVNNQHREGRRTLGVHPQDAIGISSKVAARLSGADFDGDTVIVIPNKGGKIKTKSPLKELEGFDPQSRYPGYDGMPKLSPSYKQKLMGDVSNLITDMTIKGAPDHEIAAAVRHSMVVIDAEKHNLNYKQSALDNNIASLKKKYQRNERSDARGGASTIISRAKSPIRIPERRLRKASEGGPFDPTTGKKIYVETKRSYPDPVTGKVVFRTTKVKKLEYADNAHTLSSGTDREVLYAEHSNRLKQLADETRVHSLKTTRVVQSDSAKRVYAPQVESLSAKLNTALKNAPLERQAQILTDVKVKQLRADNPDMDKAELKKLQFLVLSESRQRLGAGKDRIYIEEAEWEAIQAGAISHSKLLDILDNADIDRVKELATPRQHVLMTSAKKAQAQRLLNGGATQAQVANAMGVSLTTLKNSLK